MMVELSPNISAGQRESETRLKKNAQQVENLTKECSNIHIFRCIITQGEKY